jgi:hypothetical protein
MRVLSRVCGSACQPKEGNSVTGEISHYTQNPCTGILSVMEMLRQPPEKAATIQAMIDLDAPIVPGRSAAGVAVGSAVSDLLSTVGAHSTMKLSGGERHDLEAVKLWTKDGVITQVGVHSGYRGILQPGIRIGSTISEVEKSFGCSVQKDEEDNLVVPSSPGWVLKPKNGRGRRL